MSQTEELLRLLSRPTGREQFLARHQMCPTRFEEPDTRPVEGAIREAKPQSMRDLVANYVQRVLGPNAEDYDDQPMPELRWEEEDEPAPTQYEFAAEAADEVHDEAREKRLRDAFPAEAGTDESERPKGEQAASEASEDAKSGDEASEGKSVPGGASDGA